MRWRAPQTGPTAPRHGVQSPRVSRRLWIAGSLDRCVALGLLLTAPAAKWGLGTGQVFALFVVGTCEYAVVWLGTDWEHEVVKGIKRNNPELYYSEASSEVSEVYGA